MLTTRPLAFDTKMLFYNKDGLLPHESESVELLLYAMFNEVGDTWRPTWCRLIPDQTPLANTLRSKINLEHTIFEFVAKRYLHSHFFLTTTLVRTAELFIIDPTGVPSIPSDSQGPMRGPIIPYFGLQKYAPAPHNKVYANPEPLDDWGTREFPRNFHP